MRRDFFGYLPHDFTLSFDGGRITPVSKFDEAAVWVKEYSNVGGFIYPPIEKRKNLNPESGDWEKVPNSERPALLHRIPASHELHLNLDDSQEDIRKGPGAFVINLLAYLYGTRLQYHDWWFDGRVPVGSTHNIAVADITAEKFISFCFNTWKSLHKDQQHRIINILYMHSRAPSYEWDWEQFMIEYMVLDGCWKFAEMQFGLRAGGHKNRIKVLCEKFDIQYHETLIADIVTLRKDLFHETIWDKSLPCTATDGPGFESSLHIRKFNQRLIPAILEYDTPYIKTGWWYMGTWSFD